MASTWPLFMMEDSDGSGDGECGNWICVIGTGADGGTAGVTLRVTGSVVDVGWVVATSDTIGAWS
jgi:hypothetical protein